MFLVSEQTRAVLKCLTSPKLLLLQAQRGGGGGVGPSLRPWGPSGYGVSPVTPAVHIELITRNIEVQRASKLRAKAGKALGLPCLSTC